MGSALPALQWNLDQTVNSALSLSRGLIAAATSDNVQPRALSACEQLGATLKICPETCAKIERLVETPKPVRTFLGAYIGYSNENSVTYLLQSSAGVQFLALASPLVTTMGAYHGSLTLAMMLENSAADRTLVPPVWQLRDLLRAIECRCICLKFADLVVYCRNLLVDLPAHDELAERFWKGATAFPDPETICKLIAAFGVITAITKPGDRRLILKTALAAPWTIAFVHWFLGDFPSVILGLYISVFPSRSSPVTVIANQVYSGLDILFRQNIHTPADLIISGQLASQYWSGMLSIGSYGQWMTRELDIGPELADDLPEIMSYAVFETVRLLKTSNRPQRDVGISQARSGSSSNLPPDENILLSPTTSPFPNEAAIATSLFQLLGPQFSVALKSPPGSTRIADLPAVTIHTKLLAQKCTCRQCKRVGRVPKSTCLVEVFFYKIASLVMDTLCISLFEFPETLMVSAQHGSTWLYDRLRKHRFLECIFQILLNGREYECDVGKILERTLLLVGHMDEPSPCIPPLKVISSAKGQVAYLKLFNTHMITSRGYLTFSWSAGMLLYENEVYGYAMESDIQSTSGGVAHTSVLEGLGAVTGPKNLFPTCSLAWQVTTQKDSLEISLVCQDQSSEMNFPGYASAYTILQNIGMALILNSCQHQSNELLPGEDPHAIYTGPLDPLPDLAFSGLSERKTSCVAVDGNDALRLLALGSRLSPMVLRGSVCGGCALAVCRDYQITGCG